MDEFFSVYDYGYFDQFESNSNIFESDFAKYNDVEELRDEFGEDQ